MVLCFTASTVPWACLTPEDLWRTLVEDVKNSFGFTLGW